MDAGAVLVGGSDFPIDPLAPFQQIETAVDRLSDVPENLERWPGPLAPGEALTVDQAVMMHTLGSAYGIFQENETGSIDVGKNADLIVLDQNLYDHPVGDISDTKVMLTMTRGKIVHETPEAAAFDADGAAVDAAQPEFPEQGAGTIGPLRQVTVTAGGDRTLKIGDVSLDDDPGSEGDFLMTSENCSDRSLAPGGELHHRAAVRAREGVLDIDQLDRPRREHQRQRASRAADSSKQHSEAAGRRPTGREPAGRGHDGHVREEEVGQGQKEVPEEEEEEEVEVGGHAGRRTFRRDARVRPGAVLATTPGLNRRAPRPSRLEPKAN